MKHALLLALLTQVPFTIRNADDYTRIGGSFFLTEHAVADAAGTVREPGDDAGTSLQGNHLFYYGTAVRVECDAASTSDAIFCWSHSPGANESGSVTPSNSTATGVLSDSESAETLTGPATGGGNCFMVGPGQIKDDIPWRSNFNAAKPGQRQGACVAGDVGYRSPCNEDSDCGTGGDCQAERVAPDPSPLRNRGAYLVTRARDIGGTATCRISSQR